MSFLPIEDESFLSFVHPVVRWQGLGIAGLVALIVRKTRTKEQHISDGRGLLAVAPFIMGFYEESPPRHGHRTPAELAEDEILSSLHGEFCGMPATLEVDNGRRTGEQDRACALTENDPVAFRQTLFRVAVSDVRGREAKMKPLERNDP